VGVNNGTVPASGKVPISTLEQSIVNFAVDPNTGTLTQQDYFQPANYANLNKGDKDISSSGVALLDSTTFSGGGVNRVAVCGSKSGVLYVLDADNLGGYRMGAGGTDAVLQEIPFTTGGGFYSGVGSYPLEGGYIYMCTTGTTLKAYKLIFDNLGRPNFQYVAQSNFTLGCRGTPVVTTLNGQPGTGVVWMADSSKGLVAFNAVPNGAVLTQIALGYGTGGLAKFQRPVFGNNRAYVLSSSQFKAIAPAA